MIDRSGQAWVAATTDTDLEFSARSQAESLNLCASYRQGDNCCTPPKPSADHSEPHAARGRQQHFRRQAEVDI